MFLSELLQLAVSTEDGKTLGRVIDVRVDEEARAISGIVLDDSRFLSRLVRGRSENGRTLPLPALPWSAVIRIDRDAVVVSADSETLRAGSEKP
jgi:sporulation protein YlmC with PRC-barrel domain